MRIVGVGRGRDQIRAGGIAVARFGRHLAKMVICEVDAQRLAALRQRAAQELAVGVIERILFAAEVVLEQVAVAVLIVPEIQHHAERFRDLDHAALIVIGVGISPLIVAGGGDLAGRGVRPFQRIDDGSGVGRAGIFGFGFEVAAVVVSVGREQAVAVRVR